VGKMFHIYVRVAPGFVRPVVCCDEDEQVQATHVKEQAGPHLFGGCGTIKTRRLLDACGVVRDNIGTQNKHTHT
jgi:hypothetical protein